MVARSKCYLQLGEPQLALKDAETALHGDKNFVRGRTELNCKARHITVSEFNCMSTGFGIATGLFLIYTEKSTMH